VKHVKTQFGFLDLEPGKYLLSQQVDGCPVGGWALSGWMGVEWMDGR
jgi:hypothetical protein